MLLFASEYSFIWSIPHHFGYTLYASWLCNYLCCDPVMLLCWPLFGQQTTSRLAISASQGRSLHSGRVATSMRFTLPFLSCFTRDFHPCEWSRPRVLKGGCHALGNVLSVNHTTGDCPILFYCEYIVYCLGKGNQSFLYTKGIWCRIIILFWIVV